MLCWAKVQAKLCSETRETPTLNIRTDTQRCVCCWNGCSNSNGNCRSSSAGHAGVATSKHVVTQAAVPAVAPAAAASFMPKQFVSASPVQLRSPTECLHKILQQEIRAKTMANQQKVLQRSINKKINSVGKRIAANM